MTAVLLTPLTGQFFDNNGDPLNGGLIYSYVAGTSTPQATYTDASGGTPAANPVVCNSAGRADIWGSGVYKFVIKDSLGNTLDTIDNVTAIYGAGDMTKAIYDPANIAQQLIGITAVQTLTNKTLQTPNIVGVINGTNAASGSVGEFSTSVVSAGSAVSLTTATPTDLTSMSLTAGDWNLYGQIAFITAASTTITSLQVWINDVSVTIPTFTAHCANFHKCASFTPGAATPAFVLPLTPMRLNLSMTTTVYISAQASFGTSTLTMYGYISARRVR